MFKGRRRRELSSQRSSSASASMLTPQAALGVLLSGGLEKRTKTGAWSGRFFVLVSVQSAAGCVSAGLLPPSSSSSVRLEIYEKSVDSLWGGH